jgi:hypothetical protein
MKPEDLRARLPLPELMARLGLAENTKKQAFCPFHDNRRSPAFSVFERDGRWRWNCFAGCGSGDEIGLLEKLFTLTFPEAMRRWQELAGVGPALFERRPMTPKATSGQIELPADFRRGEESDLERVAELRGVSLPAVALMRDHGVLRFGTVCGLPCWLVTDASRRVAEARRLDGEKFPSLGSLGERKAHTIKGSSKSWPVGLALPDHRESYFERVLLVEGSGDLVAAYHFALASAEGQRWLPVALLGANCRISQEALNALRGKSVRLVPHCDAAGLKAAADWGRWLSGSGLRGDVFTLEGLRRRDGSPVKDLGDCTDLCAEDEIELGGLFQ